MELVSGAGDGFKRALVFIVFFLASFSGGAAFLGVNVNYSRGGELPRAEHVIDLLNILQIQQIKLLDDVHPQLLNSLSGSSFQVVVTLPEHLIPSLAESREAASRWLQRNVLHFHPATNVTAVVVGDQLNPTSPPTSPLHLLKAMRNIHSCLEHAGVDSQIKVTSSVSSTYVLSDLTLPGAATFLQAHRGFMHELLAFLAETNSYLMINVNAFELHLPLELPAGSPNVEVGYTNLVDAAVDSAYAAMEKLGYLDVPVVVGAIGWPWKAAGGPGSASPESAARFNEKLIKHVLRGEGTPMRKGAEVHVYVHELLDTVVGDADSGSARYGLFTAADLAPTYSLDVIVNVDAHDSKEGFGEDESLIRRVLQTTNGTGTSTGGTGQYCIAKQNAPDNILSVGLNWACGQGNADCTPIQQNGPCYLPDTYSNHASYAFNSYYQKNVGAGATCDFQGAAQLVSVDPSYNSCVYTSSTGSTGGTGTGSVGSGPSSNGILQPFNPPGNSSSASTAGLDGVMSLIMAAVLWSLRL